MPFVPHTDDDLANMLSVVGEATVESLFDEIPSKLRAAPLALPDGVGEMQMLAELSALAARDEIGPCFLGAGCYDHHIPAAVWDLASRGEFMTCYTPYQAEASQGTLQLIWEFQSMMTALTGMDVANASVYDGGSGLAEAVLMAVRANRKNRSRLVAVAGTVHPLYLDAARAIVTNQGIDLVELPRGADGRVSAETIAALDEPPAAVVVQEPNFYGLLEDVAALTDAAHACEALMIAVTNPVSLALLRPPGEWGTSGADIAIGDGQPLGVPMSSGGPSFGFMCSSDKLVRQMPGRIIGQTVDLDGNDGFTLTLQAREQHIRRGKATSNICTNQGLMVTAATIHLSLLGPQGLLDVATACHTRSSELVARLTQINGVKEAFSGAYFHERVLDLGTDAGPVVDSLVAQGVLPGLALGPFDAALTNCLLVCATERRTAAEIELFAAALQSVLTHGTTPREKGAAA